jgi:hypothetical protein
LELLFIGCASILGAGKELDLKSVPEGTTEKISNSKGDVVETIIVPAEVTLQKPVNYSIEFSKPGYISQQISIKKKFNHSFWLNFLAGAVGAGAAMGLDSLRGPYAFGSGGIYSYGAYGLAVVGIGGILYDIFTGKLTGITPQSESVILVKTPETLASEKAEAEERDRITAQQKAEKEAAEAKAKAEREAAIAKAKAERDEKAKSFAKGYTYHGENEDDRSAILFEGGALEDGHAYYISGFMVESGGSRVGVTTQTFFGRLGDPKSYHFVEYVSQNVKGEVVSAGQTILGTFPVTVVVAGGKPPLRIPVVLGLVE